MIDQNSSFFSNYDFSSGDLFSSEEKTPINDGFQQNVNLIPSENLNTDLNYIPEASGDEIDIISTQSPPDIKPEIITPNITENLQTTQTSVVDIENKYDQIQRIKNRGVNPNISGSNKDNTTNLTNSTNVVNNYSNVSTISYDYLRTLRTDYEKMPQWRAETG